MKGKVTMRGPEGDVVEVDASPESLTPLMVLGYVQVMKTKPAAGGEKKSEVTLER